MNPEFSEKEMRKKWPRLVIIWGNEWRDCRTDFETNLESNYGHIK